MELFTQLFGSLLLFVYHWFDHIVIHGYLSALTRPEQVVYFFRQIVGVEAVDKEVEPAAMACISSSTNCVHTAPPSN